MTVTKQKDMISGTVYKVYGTMSFGVGEVYTTGGQACSFAQSAIKATRKPIVVWVQGLSGFSYNYVVGTNSSNGLLKIMQGNSTVSKPAAEMPAGAVDPLISSDTIQFEAIFNGML